MKILLTGVTGFVGSQIARQLLAGDHEIVATVLPQDNPFRITDIQQRIDFRECDLFHASDETLAHLCDGIELAIHCAWYVVPGKYLEAMENLDCLRGSLRLMASLGASGCRRTIALGTCFEYDFDYGYLSESSPLKALSLYAASKTSTLLMGRQIAKTSGMSFAWPRLFYLYGPYEDPTRLVPFAITKLMDGEAAQFTSGRQIRDFMHVEDVAQAVAAVALSDISGPVNIGTGVPVTVRQVVSAIAEHLGQMDKAQFGARPDNPTDPPFICANNQKLVDLGWQPKYDLESGIAATIEWWRQQRKK